MPRAASATVSIPHCLSGRERALAVNQSAMRERNLHPLSGSMSDKERFCPGKFVSVLKIGDSFRTHCAMDNHIYEEEHAPEDYARGEDDG